MVALVAPQPTDLLRGCACAVIFTLLLSLDAWNAIIKRKAYWFPGTFLVLSALTLQFINYANYTTVNVASGEDDTFDPSWLVIDSGRVMVYVFIAYLLPGLVSSRSRGVWTNIAALALSVLAHMLSEILIFRWFWFEDLSDCILFPDNILLVPLCICAVLAGKTIRFIMNQKVPSLLSCCPNSCRECGNIGHHVLKCWIVVRCSQPEYIMARSVLSSLAGVLVTACVLEIAREGMLWYKFDAEQYIVLNRATFFVQSAFILIGWIAVTIRWLTAVIYFPRYGRCLFQVEDFWTRSLIELKYSQLNGLLWEKKDRNRTLLQTTTLDSIISRWLRTLVLSIAIFVQICVVLLSKVSLLLSWLLFWPLLMAREFMLLCGSNVTSSEFSNYSKDLESIAMPGENAESLWNANESAFKSTKEHMNQGKRSTADLINMITRLKAEATDPDEGEEMYGEEENDLNYFSKMSWKMRAVSLIHFMLCSYDGNHHDVVDAAFKACSEAWALMDFVESSDTEANLVSLAADMEFSTLKNIWKQNPIQSDEKLMAIRKRMQKDIDSRIRKGESQERVENIHDSVDWMTVAADFSLNKTWKVIESKGINHTSANAVRILGCLLAKVIVNFLEFELEQALIEKCSKWAVDGEEEKMYQACFFAGKAMSLAVLFQTGQDNNAVPPAAVAEGEENDSSGIVVEVVPPAAVAEGEENDSSGIAVEVVPPAAVAEGEENDSSGIAVEVVDAV